MRLSFLGAASTVTGSKYLIEHEGQRILVDCGLFQGYKNLRLLNWQPFHFDPASLDAVVLTHAHLDHSGAIPLLIRHGFRGPIYATPPTIDLCKLLLPDSGHIQEGDANFANKRQSSRHHPALPLYTEADAQHALTFFKPLPFDKPINLGSMKLRLRLAGHILGASSAEFRTAKGSLLFSGDLGRPDDVVMRAPVPIEHGDTLVIESTYGDRAHPGQNSADALADVITRTAARGGSILLPAFAVGRAQNLLFEIFQLKQAGRIPDMPVFLDSPMAIESTGIYQRHRAQHRLSVAQCEGMAKVARISRTEDDSRAIGQLKYPVIIISASGMATGGRVLHHLTHMAPDHRNSLVFAGYQAGGTRGAKLVEGARSVRIFGEDIAVNAEVVSLPSMSAHADATQIMDWLKTIKKPPQQVFITHGEAAAADALRWRIEHELGWPATVPLMGQHALIDAF